MPILALIWAFITVRNIAGPLSMNLFTEVIIFFRSMAFSIFSGPILILIMFFTAAYSLILISSSQQGKSSTAKKFFRKNNFFEILGLQTLVFLRYRITVIIFSNM